MRKRGALMPPVHPGEILREDFMKPLDLSVNNWRWNCTCPRHVSERLCMSGGVLRQIRR